MPQIRPLAFDDSLEALTALLHAAYASLAAQGWNFTAVDQSVAMTRERLATAQGFVAVHDGRLVGTVAVSGPKAADARYLADPVPPLYCEPGTALIAQLAVHPRAWPNACSMWPRPGHWRRAMPARRSIPRSRRWICSVAICVAATAPSAMCNGPARPTVQC
jgi:hypothetical protein